MEMSNISGPASAQAFHPNDGSPNPEQPGDTVSGAESPQKRRPGRPKGSTKKHHTTEPSPPKVKRPVGRPRKDGFPAGSVGTPRSRITKHARHSTGSTWLADMPLSGVGYPQHMMGGPTVNPLAQVPIDPNLQLDDWAVLARTKPNAFLTTLLAALAAPNPVSSAGPTVEEAFRSHLGSLAPNPAQMQPIPSLYSILKTFWLPSSPSYFSLTASASTARTPSEHRFLYWDPQPLVFNGIACPSCATPLSNRGRISSGPIKIYDIEKPFFIIGCEYVCMSPACNTPASPEGRKFASTDSSIFRSLPVKLKDEFPARLMYGDTDAGSGPNIWNWKALGVSLSLWNMVRGCLRAGMRRDAILQLVHAVQHGVSEEGEEGPSSKAEMEDDDEEAEHEPDIIDGTDDPTTGSAKSAGSVFATSGPAQESTPTLPTYLVQNLIDAYNDAWRANSGVTVDTSKNTASGSTGGARAQPEAGSSNTNTGPTPQVQATPTSSSAPPPAQVYDYTKTYASYPYAAYAFFQPASTPIPPESLKRPFPFADSGDTDGEGMVTKRSPRHCCKCGSQDCKGKGGRSFCNNGCQDCGKLDCKGRNSRRPDKKCDEGWL